MNTLRLIILAFGLNNSINGMQNNVLVLPHPAVPHDLLESTDTHERSEVREFVRRWDENTKRNDLILSHINKNNFDKAVQILRELAREETFEITQPCFYAAFTSNYKPLGHAVFNCPASRSLIVFNLGQAAFETRIPNLKRLFWQYFISCKKGGQFDKIPFGFVLLSTYSRSKPYVRNILNSLYNSIDWDNVDESIKNIEQSIRIHEAIDTIDNALLTDCLIHGAPTHTPDEFDELALMKASRLAQEEKDSLTQQKRRVLATNLTLFSKYGYTIFDLIKNGNGNIGMLLKACPTYLSPAFCDNQGNTILHASLKFGLFDPVKLFELVKLILALNPELLLHMNNNKETPVHNAVGNGRYTILRWLISIDVSVKVYRKTISDA